MYAKLYRQKSVGLMGFIGLTPRLLKFFNFHNSNTPKRLKAPAEVRKKKSNFFESPKKRKAESPIKPLMFSAITIGVKSSYETTKVHQIQ